MKEKTIKSIMDIAEKYDTFFFDMYGVIWSGTNFIDGALHNLEALKKAGKKVFVISNSTLPAKQMGEKYLPLGLIKGKNYDSIIASGDVLLDKFKNQDFFNKVAGKNGKYYIIGAQNDCLFANLKDRQTNTMEEAKLIYLGVPCINGKSLEDITPFLPELQKALKLKLEVLCANPDYFAIGKKGKHICQGSLAKWYEENGGKVYWVGKPAYEIFEYAEKIAKSSKEKSIMIGDTIRTDIKGAADFGIDSILVTKIGITHDELENGKSLHKLCEESCVIPTYLVERIGK